MDRPDPTAETALFWHIPKSGGTTAKRLYQCMGQTLAHRVGADPRYGHDRDAEIVVFEPHGGKDWKVVNVDTTIKPGILRAKEMGLVQSHTSDLIFTMEPQFAGQELYDEDNKGRFLALFRHPVDRALSMFFYLGTATWERTYRPEWANMTVLEWTNLEHAEEDYMVHKLTGKKFGDKVDETDLIIAKELVRQRFIVGLMEEMNESIRRFNIVLGVDDESERSQQCMVEFGLVDAPVVEQDGERTLEEVKTRATDKKNSNKHPKFEEGSPEYDIIAGRNRLDMLLYKYIESLFESQEEIIDSYLRNEQPQPAEDTNNILVDRMELQDEQPQPAEGTDDDQDYRMEPESAAEITENISRLMLERENTDDDQDYRMEPESAKLTTLLPLGSEAEPVRISTDYTNHLANINDPPSESDTALFWHVPKSGGTNLQRLYWCMGSTIANEVGVNPKFGKYEGPQSELVAFSPWNDNPGKVVNVDIASHDGILEAKQRGFLIKDGQPHVDFVSTSEFNFASAVLFSPDHKARVFALFRHPIERAVSKFFYLQKATWEPTYNQRWADMSLEKWASRKRGEDNWMVRHLVCKGMSEELTNADLELAKDIVSNKFVVGLQSQFEESVRRFNLLLGVDNSDPTNSDCINKFTSHEGGSDHSDARNNEKEIVTKNEFNSYEHPHAERGGPAWISLAKIHMYDVLLYRHVLAVYNEQGAMFRNGKPVAQVARRVESLAFKGFS